MLKQLPVVSTNSVNGQLFLTALLICQCRVCCQSRRPCSVFCCWHQGYANEHMNQLSPPQTPCMHAGDRRMCAKLHWLQVTGREGETASFSFLKCVFFPFLFLFKYLRFVSTLWHSLDFRVEVSTCSSPGRTEDSKCGNETHFR